MYHIIIILQKKGWKRIFSYDKNDDKKEIHIEVSRRLFPYLQSTTSALMAMAGIPNFVVPENELKIEDVTV